MSANVTTGRRTVPAIACTDNQLREIVARMQQSMVVLGNPAPAGAQNPPIATIPYPWTIAIDFELLTPFDEDGHAMATEVDTDGTIPIQPAAPDPPAPAGSPVPPLVHTVCTWPGAHAAAVEGDRGHAIRRVLTDGTICWWVIFIIEGDPLGGPEDDFEFEGDLTDETGGDPAEGDPTFTPHGPPHSGQAICFTTAEDSWVNFGERSALPAAGGSMALAFWCKVAHSEGTIFVINRSSEHAATEWHVTTHDDGAGQEYFLFQAILFESGGGSIAGGAAQVSSPGGSWTDDDWNFVVVNLTITSDSITAGISVDGSAFETFTSMFAESAAPADQGGLLLANINGYTAASPPTSPPSSGINGEATYCLDNIRFWDDRELTQEEAEMLYNEGVIE